MELSPPRESRGRSVELDGRRINAVPSMHTGESVLQNLWKEHQQQQQQQQQAAQAVVQLAQAQHPSSDQKSSKGSGSSTEDNDRKLQSMLEKYQSQVKLQQQQSQRNPAGQQTKTISRNNLHKIGKIASQRIPSNIGPQGNPMSHSQPCLIAISDRPPEYSAQPASSSNGSSSYQRRSSGSGSGEQHPEFAPSNIPNHRVPNNTKLIQSLREENLHLKREAESMKKKLTKLQQIESAYERIERDYEALLHEKERQDSIEKNALIQMEMHMQRLVTEKEMLQDRLEQMQPSVNTYQSSQHIEKINQLNMMLAEMITQNKDLQDCKDRQKLELDAQSATLDEQRNHIAMLEKALSNAQDRLAKREKACEELARTAERANSLQRQLHESLLDKQDRDESHAAERAQWEMEMAQLRMQLNKDSSINGSLKRTGGARLSVDGGDELVQRLKKTIYSKDEKITQLERTVVELQRKLHDESERMNSALRSVGDNYDTKIKRLEEEKSEKDRRIAQLLEEKEKERILLEDGRERSDLFYSRDRDTRDLNKMEEIRQKIQERKRKGRICATGGLIGLSTPSDQSTSSSGSFVPSPAGHRRTSSGPFETPVFDHTVLTDLSLSAYSNSKPPGDPNGNVSSQNTGMYTTTVAFKNDPHDIMTRTA